MCRRIMKCVATLLYIAHACQDTVHRQDLVSHQLFCESRSVSCDDCREVMSQKEYQKHPYLFRTELDENKRGLFQVWKVLQEIQDQQRLQGEEIRQMARELRQLPATVHGHQGDTLKRHAGKSEQRNLGGYFKSAVQPNTPYSETRCFTVRSDDEGREEVSSVSLSTCWYDCCPPS